MSPKDSFDDGIGGRCWETSLGIRCLKYGNVVWNVSFGVGALANDVCSGAEGL